MDKQYAYEVDLIKNMFHDRTALLSALEEVKADMFTDLRTKALFWVISSLWKDDKTISVINIEARVFRVWKGDPDEITHFIQYIEESKPENDVWDDIEFVVNEYRKRKLRAYTAKLYSYVQKDVFSIKTVSEYLNKMMDVASDGLDEEQSIDSILDADNLVIFQKPFLRRLFKGVLRGNLTTIAGDTGHTKTTLTIFMINEWLEQGYKVVVFSVELTYKEFFKKLISLRRRINSGLLIETNEDDDGNIAKLTEREEEEVREEIKELKEKYISTKKLIVRDNINNVTEMNLLIRKEKPDVVVIDPIQAIEMPDGELNKNMAFGLPEVLKSLKTVSKQVNCAIVLVAWMTTNGKRPEPWMMYASKAMERWSAKVWMLYYYYKVKRIPAFKNIMEVIDGKSRFGESGIKLVKIIPEYGIYERLEEDPVFIENYKKITGLK